MEELTFFHVMTYIWNEDSFGIQKLYNIDRSIRHSACWTCR